MASTHRTHALLVRIGDAVGGLPIADVVETLRPLPIQPLAGMPPYVCGLSIIRGAPHAVVDLSRLVTGHTPAAFARFVVVRVGGHRMALAVEEVMGVREIETPRLQLMPSLLSESGRHHASGLGGVDEGLLLMLASSRVLLEDVARILDSGDAP
jgi:purine-binding chemotaxis protein CheW